MILLYLFLTGHLVKATDMLWDNSTCPPWTTSSNGTCECGDSLEGAVKCESKMGVQAVLKCFCMTFENKSNMTVLGSCMYTCNGVSTHYNISARTPQDLDKFCRKYSRTGVMCGECIEGYGLPVYSYSLACVECSHYKYNWLKYIAVAYIPLTLFYFLVIICRISATSGVLIGYVTISQMVTVQGLATWQLQDKSAQWLLKWLLPVLSVWNLDFFRTAYPPFCIHPKFPAFGLIMLDYIVAVYPLVLIVCTYALVRIYNRFRIIVWLCGPVYRCLHHFRKEWDIKVSLIGAFATFFLLSYVKIIHVTATILTPTRTYNMNGTKNAPRSYYDPSLEYFGKNHKPYAIFAIFFSLMFTFLPLIVLCLYPCGCFHWCLNKTRCKWQALHIFMDDILGSYTYKPRERRYFGALYLGIRIFHVLGFSVLQPVTYLTAVSYMTIITIMLVALFQPYKTKSYVLIDAFLFYVTLHNYLGYIFFQETSIMDIKYGRDMHKYAYLYSAAILRLTLPLYGIFLLIIALLPRRCIKAYAAALHRRFYCQRITELQESLPYRAEQNHLVESFPKYKSSQQCSIRSS